MTTRRVKLKITSASRQTIRLRAESLRARCLICEREVEIVTEAEAQRILQVDSVTFDGLAAAGHVHTIQTVSGNLQVCKDSLFQKK